ncbi:MAG: putative competence-damage inducible protein [Fimbriimonadales bacterium]|nr:MAG: putative competence-damage inducible protein [Fimbriimonadales bacterium]
MTVEIVSIGTELLLGQIVDTNAAWLSARLAEVGVEVYRRTTVGDNLTRIVTALREALERADGVIAIGGLGPTDDDLTREAFANIMGEPLVLDAGEAERLKAFFAARGRAITERQLRQAMRPASAQPIPNPNGTAPGLYAEWNGKLMFALPGPPNEFVPMATDAVLPRLAERTGGRVIRSRVVRLCGIGESDAEAQLSDLILSENPTLAPLAKLGEVHFRITARADSPDVAEQMIAQMEHAVRERLGAFIFGVDETTLEQAVVQRLIEAGQSLAVAESCTGGLLGHRITSVPGSSEVFLGGVISYSNSLKEALLGVPRRVLETHGAVSEPTARAMAEGVRERLGSWWGIGITGIAGPSGGTPDKPVGLVYISISDPTATVVKSQVFPGDRATVKYRATQYALWLLYQGVKQGGCDSLLQR